MPVEVKALAIRRSDDVGNRLTAGELANSLRAFLSPRTDASLAWVRHVLGFATRAMAIR